METRVFAGRLKDRAILEKSSSGGAFTALSDDFIDRGMAVLCAGYNYETDRTEFRMVFTKEDRDACRGSMYMQSYALDSWKEAVKWLGEKADNELIFFGAGCQGAAFLEFCNRKGVASRVTVVDIICHGAPSPGLWREYADTLKKRGRLEYITFKDKRNGWNSPTCVARIDDKEVSIQKWRKTYSARVMLRPCCSSCPYTVIDRKTDITIGDFWHIEDKIPDFYDDKGTSLFLIHTEKGAKLFDRIRDRIEVRESNRTDCWQTNLEKPTAHALDRQDFWRDYRKKGIDFVMEKYGTSNLRRKIQRRIRYIISKVR
jgi:coenzyme F420-reducing hydrogenase beta subunit